MARRASGPLVFFKRVRQAAMKARPYLVPSGAIGRRVIVVELRRGIATMSTVTKRTVSVVAARAVKLGAFASAGAARRKVPVDRGRLKGSIHPRERTPILWTVGTNVVYARPVEEGVRGGKIIRPRRARVLSFRWRNAPAAVRRRFRGRRRGGRR